ncbi:MAG: YdeI/OmpD-associated family protein [Chloroflexota bacterium]
MPSFYFQAVLKRPEEMGNWTYLEIPLDLTAIFGKTGQIKVRGTLNDVPFHSVAKPHGDGTHYLIVSHATRVAAGVAVGDSVQIMLEGDTEVRQIIPPPDFAQALEANPKAKEAFEALAYTHRKEYVEWIESAKKESTRQTRIQRAVELLLQNLQLSR